MASVTSNIARSGICALVICLAAKLGGARAAAASCTKLVLSGEVNAGQTWQTPLGQGWVFRIQPISPGADYSGWDLVVDRDPQAGYPDALLLATPPYYSINEREIGTTFGVRAQDAIGWNPRTFHFMIDAAAFREAQQIFLRLEKSGQLRGMAAKNGSHDLDRLLSLEKNTAAGEVRIEDVHLTPGIADPAPFAQAWALAAARMPHEVVPAPDGKSSPRGSLLWMRFSVTLWLPASWKLPAELKATPAPCIR